MKKSLLILSLLSFLFIFAFGENLNQALHIFHSGKKTAEIIPTGAIKSVEFQPKEDESGEFDYVLQTEDGKRIFGKVDSICLNLPHLKGYKHLYTIPDEEGEVIINVSSSDSANNVPVIIFPNGRTETMERQNTLFSYAYRHQVKDKSFADTLIVKSGDLKDTLILQNTGEPFLRDDGYKRVFFPKEGGFFEVKSSLPIEYSRWNNEEVPIDESEGLSICFEENKDNDEKKLTVYIEKVGDLSLVKFLIFNQNNYQPVNSLEVHKAALLDLYNNCNGENWSYKRDWLSEKPIWQWECINNDIWGGEWRMDYVRHVQFGGRQYNGLKGTLPESFTVFLDDAEELDFSNGALHGVIPYNVRHHKNWPKLGWGLLDQFTYYGGGFDTEDLNLRIDDVEIENFMTGEVSTTYAELAKHKLTWVFNGGAVDMIGGISDLRVNKYLDYKEKGLGLVVTVGEYWDTPYDNYKKWIEQRQDLFGLPQEIQWTKGFDKGDFGPYGSMTLLDPEGNVLHYISCDGDRPDVEFVNEIDSVCKVYLGDPVEHEPYRSYAYSSTDYSHDGEVMTLQKATVGKGIDLVLLGDEYIDKWMGEGEMYETDMKQAMEQFFSTEPFATFRDRFNVYTVKVVSKNAYDGEDHRINHNNEVCFEYASKIPGVDLDNVTIAVISGNPNFSFFVSGCADMLASGASIAYLGAGGPSSLIVHEAGGHGFAKLLDEYIFGGYEENECPEESRESFKEWLNTNYHSRGWGVNVAATDDPEKVPWAHFLKDPRYQNEVGIYQGAWFWPKDLWRASETSNMMDSGNLWFNAPSREAIYKRVMSLSEDNWEYDYETFVAFDQEVMKKQRAKAPSKNDNRYIKPTVVEKGAIVKTPNFTLPKDARLIRAEHFEGDIRKERVLNFRGERFVIER